MLLLEPNHLAALVLFILVGVSLGLLGGGGSILAVPILVYVSKVSANVSIPLSLLIVGVSSLTASISHYRLGHIDIRAAIIVGLGGVLGASQGAKLTHFFSQESLILIFGSLMMTVGLLMVSRKRKKKSGPARIHGLILFPFIAGAMVGLLTGFLGVGGGFLLVPVLFYAAKLPIEKSIGTSLLLITVNSVSGFISHLAMVSIPWDLAVAYTSIAILGALIGIRAGKGLDNKTLRKAFGFFILILGTVLFLINLPIGV